MRRVSDFLPAFFCALYLEHLVFFLSSISDSGYLSGDWVYAGPPLGLLLAIVVFSLRSGFWRRFTRFYRCMLLALATVAIASVPTGILLGLGTGSSGTFWSFFTFLILSAIASIVWLPLALLISGIYCLLLWAWEGRSDPNHFAGKLVLGFPASRPYLLGLLSFGFILLFGFFWHRLPASPSWINFVTGDIDLLSIASGKSPDGTEVVLAADYYHSGQEVNDMRSPIGIVSLDAHDGHLRWMQRYSQVLRDMAGKSPALVNDPDGDVVIGWNSQPIDPLHPVISKLSGIDGHVVWERRAETGQILNANLDAPIPDGMGRIWIAGAQGGQSGSVNRVMALLDSRDGTSHWEKIMRVSPDQHPGQLFPLKDGDAFWFLTPDDHDNHSYTPVGIQRISGKDGATQWAVDCPSQIGEWIPVVDERHQQVVIFSISILPQGGQTSTVISYDLHTGKERWRSVDNSREFRNMLKASLDDKGDLVLWRSFGERIPPNSSFGLLSMLIPLPLSQSGGAVTTRMRSVREVFSNADGTLLQSQSFANSSETVQAILSRPGSNQADALILRNWTEYEQSGHMMPWKAVFLNRYFWQNLLARQPGGPNADWKFSSHAVLTASGKLVIACPFGKDDPQKWRIAAW
jgi:hypothetical protein